MNDVSWLIYLASVASSLRDFLEAIAVLSTVGLALAIPILAWAGSVNEDMAGAWRRPLKWLWLPVIAGMFSVIIPSSQTVYLIAASEVGEAVATSPDATEMMDDVKAIIKKRLKEQLGE